MPSSLMKRYVFTAQEIARQNAALFDLLANNEKIPDVFKQVGLPSLAALYLDCLKGQIEKNKHKYIDAIVRDIYRLAGFNPDQYKIDINWILQYLPDHYSKGLYNDLVVLLKLLIKQDPKAAPEYSSVLRKLSIACLIMQGNSLFLSYLLSDTRVVNLPVMVEIFYALQIGQDKKLEQNILYFIYEFVEAFYQQTIANDLLKSQERDSLVQLSSLIKAGDYAGALNKLKALKSEHVLSQLACSLLEARLANNYHGLSVRISDHLKAFQAHLFKSFVKDVHRLGGIIFYHPNYPKGRSLSVNVHAREIIETDVATKQEIHRITYPENQDMKFTIIQYLQDRFHLNNHDIAYILLNMSQNDCCAQCEIANNIAYNFNKENVIVFPAIPPNTLHFSLILDKQNQLRYLIGQSEMLGIQEGKDARKTFRFGMASLVHAIPSNKKRKLEPVESYLPGSFPAVNVGVVYEPSSSQGELHYLSEQRSSKRIVNFLLRPVVYLKSHPFKSILWFGLGAGVTVALILAWPFIAGLLLGTGLAGIAAAISNFVSSLALIYLITAPIGLGFVFWGLIALFKGGESNSSVIQMVPNDSNFVIDKIAEVIAESKEEAAQVQNIQRSASSPAQVLNRLEASNPVACVGHESELSLFSPAGSTSSVLSKSSQDSGELHPAVSDEAVPDKKSFCFIV